MSGDKYFELSAIIDFFMPLMDPLPFSKCSPPWKQVQGTTRCVKYDLEIFRSSIEFVSNIRLRHAASNHWPCFIGVDFMENIEAKII